mmetsp:Transcript_9043/g.20404  ORF Transcript_9043/g.20404 Transcript_9043/m.20404 type:complete len:83 (+) Transcript_9043:202-450(+)
MRNEAYCIQQQEDSLFCHKTVITHKLLAPIIKTKISPQDTLHDRDHDSQYSLFGSFARLVDGRGRFRLERWKEEEWTGDGSD